ncbi:hypothetical protein FACS1894140_6700 [Spirochaetia bacterium]|nr:hypothetical protein FACS1894140_6700 [Spirochaetia bacterium]
MSDMLVKLYALEFKNFTKDLYSHNVLIKRAFITDKDTIVNFATQNFTHEHWSYECEYALYNNPISCHIAVKDTEIVGFSCYDATTKGFFGPMGVKDECRKLGIGKALLMQSLYSMKESGYAYAIIGWVANDAIPFYQKCVNAAIIEDSPPNKSIYKNMILQK